MIIPLLYGHITNYKYQYNMQNYLNQKSHKTLFTACKRIIKEFFQDFFSRMKSIF